MKLVIVGATGPAGRELVRQALDAGYEVTAIARRPEEAGLPPQVRVVKGDVMKPETLGPALAGSDAVASVLGSKLSRQPTTLLSQGTRNLVEAMKQAGVKRLVCVTGIGAGDSKGHGGFVYDKIIQPLLLNEIYKDKTRQEEVVRASGLAWTIVRPAQLTNGPKTGKFRTLTDLKGVTATKISRADVAGYILSIIGEAKTQGQTVLMTY
ncbi:MAG: NAD(P)H-binding protein [Tepidisphaera sp.]|nr:NAD(P)H-binding protein [Tepidisphaera sp.]